MVKGATQPCQSPNGSYVERQGFGPYEALGYVPLRHRFPSPALTRSPASPEESGGLRRRRSSMTSMTSRSPSSPPASYTISPAYSEFMRALETGDTSLIRLPG